MAQPCPLPDPARCLPWEVPHSWVLPGPGGPGHYFRRGGGLAGTSAHAAAPITQPITLHVPGRVSRTWQRAEQGSPTCVPPGALFSVACNSNVCLEAAPAAPRSAPNSSTPWTGSCGHRSVPWLGCGVATSAGTARAALEGNVGRCSDRPAAEIPCEDSREKCSPGGFWRRGPALLRGAGLGVSVLPGMSQAAEGCGRQCRRRPPSRGPKATAVPVQGSPSLTLRPLIATSLSPQPCPHPTQALPCPVLGALRGSPSWSFGRVGKSCSGAQVGRGTFPQTPPQVWLSWSLPAELSSPSASSLGQ